MDKTNRRADLSRLKGKTEVRRRGQRRRITPRHHNNRLVQLSRPDVNAGPRRCAIPRDVSAARPLAFACHVDFWGGVPTSRPRLDGTRSGQRREKSQWRWGRGSESGGAGERGGRNNRRHRRERGDKRRIKERAAGNRLHHNERQPAARRI